MGKKLKTHPASLKIKEVLESFSTNNVAETARKYGLNANQLSMRRSYFQEHGPAIFQKMSANANMNWKNRSPRWSNYRARKNWRSNFEKKVLGFLRPRELAPCWYVRALVK
jgi:transposase-like protein